MKLKSILFILFVSLLGGLYAQESTSLFEPHSVNLTVEAGLPSNEVYDVLEDSIGRQWFCTDNGLAVFDGQKFIRVVDSSCSVVFLISEKDPEGNLWFVTLVGDVLKAKPKENSLAVVFKSDSLQDLFGGAIISDMAFIDGNLILSAAKSLFSLPLDNTKGEPKKIVPNENQLLVLSDGNNTIAAKGKVTTSSFELKLVVNGNETSFSSKPFMKSSRNATTGVLRNEHLFILEENSLTQIKLSDGSYIREQNMPKNTTGIYIHDDMLWVGSYSDGLKAYSLDGNLTLKQHIFREKAISKFKVDNSKGKWICSQEEGVFFIPNFAVQSVDTRLSGISRITSTFKRNNEVSFGEYKGGAYFIDMNEENKAISHLGSLSDQISFIGLYPKDSSVKFISQKEILKTEKGNQLTSIKPRRTFIGRSDIDFPFSAFRTVNKRLYKRINKGDKFNYSLIDSSQHYQRIRVIEDFKDFSLIGNFNQVFYVDNRTNEVQQLAFRDKTIDFRAAAIYSEDEVALGTKGEGLLILNKNDMSLKAFEFGLKKSQRF